MFVEYEIESIFNNKQFSGLNAKPIIFQTSSNILKSPTTFFFITKTIKITTVVIISTILETRKAIHRINTSSNMRDIGLTNTVIVSK